MKLRFYVLGILLVLLFSSIFIKGSDLGEKDVLQVNSEGLSNKKVCWGIKRADNHQQPDLGSVNKKMIEEADGLAMGNAQSKFVYLTFDQGYEAGYTNQILDVLKENDVKAIFFITAHYMNTQEALIRRMIDEGHAIGNHTVNHKVMTDISDEELKNEVMNLHSAMHDKFNYEMTYFRPPKGEYSQRTLALTNNLGYKTVMWSFAYDDWDENKQKGEVYAKSKIIDNVHPGAIILLHGNSKDNANVLDYCIKEIKNMGYEFKTLDEFEK